MHITVDANRLGTGLMRKYLLRIFITVLLLSAVGGSQAASTSVAATGDAACLAWDITGQWQYRASFGGYGTMIFQQNESGAITGSWYNAAYGGSGTLQGNISGASVYFSSGQIEEFWATVAPDGLRMTGTFTYSGDFGTWEATGSAECLQRQSPPPVATANVLVRWGNHLYRRAIQVQLPSVSNIAPDQTPPAGLPVITFLGETQIEIEIVYYGPELPQSLTVFDRVSGVDIVIGALQRVEILPDGGVRYRGQITVQPRGTISPGQRQIHDVITINPWGGDAWVARIVMQLIDPSGYIYDATTNDRITGAIASCYQKVGGQWVLWNATPFDQTNPQPSNSVGHYGWDVPQGEYKVKVSKSCYADAESEVILVPPPRTDVHFSLTPLGCSAAEIDDVWTTGGDGVPLLEFLPGQEVATHMQVNNDESSDSELVIEWTTTGPSGQRIPELSGSDTYILPSNTSIDVTVAGHLPTTSAPGAYTQTTQTTHNQQTSMLVSQFDVLPSPGLFLPLILHASGTANPPTTTPTPTTVPPTPTPTATPTQPAESGIYGRVTDNGVAVGSVTLALRFDDGNNWSTSKTTMTASDGRYRFSNVSALGNNQEYYVRYGPNNGDNTRVYYWFGPAIESYSSGSNVHGGDFDIEDVALLSPSPGATVNLPATFQWRRRGNSGESYRLILFDPDSTDGWITDDLGDVGNFTLSDLPSGARFGKEYGWYLEVHQGEDNYGWSYYNGTVTFSSGATQQTDAGVDAGWTKMQSVYRDKHVVVAPMTGP